METFHFALKPNGFLFLGEANQLTARAICMRRLTARNAFFRADKSRRASFIRCRICRRRSGLTNRRKFPQIVKMKMDASERISYGELHGRILEQFAPPSIIVNEQYDIVHVSPNAGRFLQISAANFRRICSN